MLKSIHSSYRYNKNSQKSRTTLFHVLIGLIIFSIYINGSVLQEAIEYPSFHSEELQRQSYRPSHLEKSIMQRSRSELHFDIEGTDECDFYSNQSNHDLFSQYNYYLTMLDNYSNAVKRYNSGLTDIRQLDSEDHKKICISMDKVLKDNFKLDSLSLTSGGYIEPLIPPMRHPGFCLSKISRKKLLLSIDYLVHDFGAMCRHLNSTSRTVFLDLGASPEFHNGTGNPNPAFELIQVYSKFGIKFDHYYAYEFTFIPPDRMYHSVPFWLLPSYHWFNVPVESLQTSKHNPWASIITAYNENDLIIIKLDIDSPEMEISLIQQLLHLGYARLVDQLYFEHHVKMAKMMREWRETANGTLQDSLDLFTQLRKKGISAHSWV